LLHADGTKTDLYGYVLPKDTDDILVKPKYRRLVTSNQTEMAALLFALSRVPDTWYGHVYSDSKVSLGRLFWGYKWTNIPEMWMKGYEALRSRLVNWESIQQTHLDGHPNQMQLETGIGKRGNPVSVHNVACDRMCRYAAKLYMELLEKQKAMTPIN